MKTLTSLAILLAAVLFTLLPVTAAVRVVTATTDFADITRQIGGNRVQVDSLARGDQDLHHVDPRPSFVTKLSNADVVVRIGMDLDLWMDSLLAASRNSKVSEGGAGYVNASAGIKPIEVPSGKVDASKGDIHIYGNPHYWLDPENGKIIAKNILGGLKRVDPAGATQYQQNYERFVKQVDEHMATWKKAMEPLRGTSIVQYHTTWDYFLQRFGIGLAGMMEPKPGIPPSPAHISDLVGAMKQAHVRIVMTTSYYPSRFTDLLHRETGATILVLPSSVGGTKEATDYCALFDTTIAQMLAVK